MFIGESAVGAPPNDAHVNLYIGPQNGPVGTALATAAAMPRQGYIPLATVLKPNILVKPYTLFVGKADVRSEKHGDLHYGAAQIGVAEGLTRAVNEGHFPPEALDEWCVIAAVWLDWAANDDDAVFLNNRQATYESAIRAMSRFPSKSDLNEAFRTSGNRYYRPKQENRW